MRSCRILRYEDMLRDLPQTLQDIVQYFGLEMGSQGSGFFAKDDDGTSWKREIGFKEAEVIQSICQDAMRSWGYERAENEFELFRFDPVGRSPPLVIP